MRFDLVDLQLFLAVAETRSITAGAARANLALASASARIKGLEEALGVALLTRGRRGVTLTAPGESLFAHARIVLQDVETMRGDLAEQVRAVRAEGGEGFSVTIDPMYQWFGPNESLASLKSLEQFGPGIRVEDPFPEDRPDFWRRARQVCAVPLVWHARGLASLRRALQEGCADAFNCSGVAREFLTYAGAVEVAGFSCWRGSSLELGIGQAAGIHAAAAARACVMPSDFQSGVIREHTLVTWDWPYRGGLLPVPPGSGLGVELDRAALSHYARATREYVNS